MMLKAWKILAVLAGLLCLGCSDNLPHYSWVDGPTALRSMSAQARKIQSVSASCLLKLQRADGEAINFDAAMVLRPPAELRLRAWKMNQAVFDLTLKSGGVWMVMPDDPSRRQTILPAGVSAAQFARGWATFCGDMFAQGQWVVGDAGGDTVRMQKPLEDGATLCCTVDRRSLTVREYRIVDGTGKTRYTLTAAAYRAFGDIVWPMALTASSDTGKITIHFDDIELNQDLPPDAFTPPQRAEKLP